ncbi:polyphenol oxidoreductase, partial [bacterium]|nr:polyphenol oxidoreductase [bacterium]
QELIARFKERFPSVPEALIEPAARRLDLIAVNRSELDSLGVRVESVSPECTFCSEDECGHRYFSYRRGDRESRQYSIITLG